MSEKKISGLIGFLLFIIALIIYTLTLEPTASFWDCSEFIACAYKLEVGHAPGAPMFMLLGRFFSLFAGGDSSNIAFMINMLSAVASALTVMFLFWTICWFAEKLLIKSSNEYSGIKKISLKYGSAAIGALTYAFTDSFWFSAVEGEVYATSSLFSAIVLWAILKWEQSEEGWKSTRWIILIFYLLGLSVGIHLLNILTLPALALIFYYKKFKPTAKGTILTIIISFLLIVILIFGIIPGVAGMAAYSDLLFVNSFNLPVYSGAISFIIVLSGTIYYAYKQTLNRKRKWLNTAVMAFSFWLIGYSSFTLLVIRSNANPFVDMNNVENIFGLVNYLNREQYPKRPLFYGNNYNSPIVDVKKRYTYKLYDGKYHKDELNPRYVYDNKTLTLFPRMASNEPGHSEAYQNWIKIKGKPVQIRQQDGNNQKIQVPTFGENLQFFFKYQIGHMYFRYFMWNFSGRQNDRQGRGSYLNGNWITGINFIDKALIGPEDNKPSTDNSMKSRNVYYMLPLLLGILGLVFHYRKDMLNFMVNLMLFVLTGIAIVVYLNEIPITPRERDYAFVGSFYAFSIWIGLGCLAIIDKIKSIRNNKLATGLVLSLLFVLVPLNLLFENWDDHNRSNRYTVKDYAKNILESCEKDAILFTAADNDTYPIWYIQEVESFRTDIRQILQPFIPIDWYANQLSMNYFGRGKIEFSFKGTDLLMSKNRYFPIINKIDSAIDLKDVIEFITSKDPRTQVRANDNNVLDYLPGNKLTLTVDKENFLKSCTYCNLDENQIPDKINFELQNQYLNRDELFILDILANNDWKRPVYFINQNLLEKLGLSEYLHREGILYRFLPFKNELPAELAYPRALFQYQTIKNKFNWGNVNDKDVYLDHINVQMVSMLRYRQMFAEIAKKLITFGENEKAVEMLDLGMTIFPGNRIPYSFFIHEIAEAYYLAGANDKGDKLAKDVGNYVNQNLKYYQVLRYETNGNSVLNETRKELYILQELIGVAAKYSPNIHDELYSIFEDHYSNLGQ